MGIARLVSTAIGFALLTGCGGQVGPNAAQPPADGGAAKGSATGSDASDGDTTESAEAGHGTDTTGGDASHEFSGAPACGPENCGGCCTDTGDCAGGLSKTTCGLRGARCRDCADGLACEEGACVAPSDAAAPECSPAACANTCVPVYQSACCKSDGTCGCRVNFVQDGSSSAVTCM